MNTEMFLTLKVDQKTPSTIGDHKITYIVKDGSSGFLCQTNMNF